MFGRVVGVGAHHALVIKADHQVLCRVFTEQAVMVTAVGPGFSAVIKTNPPWGAEHGANVALGGFADFNLGHK